MLWRMEEQVERLAGVPSVGTEPGKPRAVAKSVEANKSKQTAQSGKRKRAPKLDKKATQAAASGAPDSSCSKPRDGAQAAGAMVTPIATLPVSERGCADIAQESSPLLSLSTPVTPSPSQVHGSMPVATDAPAAAGTKTVRFADVCGSETSLVSSMPHDIFADYQPQRRVTLKPVIYQEPSSSEDEGADDGAASSTSRAKRLKLKINATSSSTVSASTLDDLDSDFSVDNSNSDSSEDSSGTSNGSEAGSSDDDLYELGAAVLPVLNTASPVEVPKPLGQALPVKRPFTVEEVRLIKFYFGCVDVGFSLINCVIGRIVLGVGWLYPDPCRSGYELGKYRTPIGSGAKDCVSSLCQDQRQQGTLHTR